MLIRRAVEEMSLDLSGATVLTEAASGPYVVTPVIAAVAGAHVAAVTKTTRYGTVEEITAATVSLAGLLGVADRIAVHADGVTEALVRSADIVTNSGHVRPIDRRFASWMRTDAVVSLMCEAWEIGLGRDDVDVVALRDRGIRFAGINERIRQVDVFSYLGPQAVKLLHDAGVAVYRSSVLLVCDNDFAPYLTDGLRAVGAELITRDSFDGADLSAGLDAIVIALTPSAQPVLGEHDIAVIAERAPAAVVAQFWGDVPRDVCARHGVPCVPVVAPAPGHMGALPSAVGPEPIVRLQAGGLKVGQILRKSEADRTDDEKAYVDEW
jgi:hypothetical protein